jgi:hypothetical protein
MLYEPTVSFLLHAVESNLENLFEFFDKEVIQQGRKEKLIS